MLVLLEDISYAFLEKSGHCGQCVCDAALKTVMAKVQAVPRKKKAKVIDLRGKKSSSTLPHKDAMVVVS